MFRFQDAVTSRGGEVRQVIAEVTINDAGEWTLVRDEEVLAMLNQRNYPDVAVVCDPSDTDAYVKRCPCLLAEVLSPSTQTTDLREKWLAYGVIPGLAYYLVVSADRRRVQIHQRSPGGDWEVALLGPDETLEVRCGGLVANINLDLIYEDVAVPAANEAAGWG